MNPIGRYIVRKSDTAALHPVGQIVGVEPDGRIAYESPEVGDKGRPGRCIVEARHYDIVDVVEVSLCFVVPPGWVEHVTGGPEGYVDIFSTDYSGSWFCKIDHNPGIGFLAYSDEDSAGDAPKEEIEKEALASWDANVKALTDENYKETIERLRRTLPEGFYVFDRTFAAEAHKYAILKYGADWFERVGDATTYDAAVQMAAFDGEIVYG